MIILKSPVTSEHFKVTGDFFKVGGGQFPF